ncbi:hypothetical protein JOM56_010347 [Amanita muscaria]
MGYPIVAGAKEPWPPLPEGEDKSEDKFLDDSNIQLGNAELYSLLHLHLPCASIALLDSVFLPLHLSPSITVYGMPRIGNQAFAAYVDSHCNATHVNNKTSCLPIQLVYYDIISLRAKFILMETDTYNSCPGQDKPNLQVPSWSSR